MISAPQTISEPFSLQIMMRRKDGKVLRCNSRHQAFYNELGYVRALSSPSFRFIILPTATVERISHLISVCASS
jgi:hypothetical protein